MPVRRGIFQGDSFSPLLFVITLLPLTHILRDTGMWYQLENNGAKFNHLFFMDDLKLYGKNDKETDSSIKMVWQCSEDIKMESGILKCAVVSLQRGRKTRWEGIHLSNGDEIDEAGAEGYKYLGVLEIDKITCDEKKRKVKDGNVGRRLNVDKQNEKSWCRNVYDCWNDIDFKDRFHSTHENFNFTLEDKLTEIN